MLRILFILTKRFWKFKFLRTYEIYNTEDWKSIQTEPPFQKDTSKNCSKLISLPFCRGFDSTNRCKNKFDGSNERIWSWSRNGLSHKINFKAVLTHESIATAWELKAWIRAQNWLNPVQDQKNCKLSPHNSHRSTDKTQICPNCHVYIRRSYFMLN